MPGQISIHALLAESDNRKNYRLRPTSNFYPRSPCGERLSAGRECDTEENFYPRSPCGERQLYINRTAKAVIFLSTLSLRRATRSPKLTPQSQTFLSTLSLRRATDTSSLMQCQVKFLSTLSLRRATSRASRLCRLSPFLSTLSLRRATAVIRRAVWAYYISIHALLAESDCILTIIICTVLKFLSTLSLRRATSAGRESDTAEKFLSTLSLRRATHYRGINLLGFENFYPRSPCGERRQ